LSKFKEEPDLLPLGHQIIDCCLASGAKVEDFARLLPDE